MKTLKTFILLLFVPGLCIQFLHAQNFSPEEQAAIAVVEKEHKAWADREYDSWKDQWIHNANVIHINTGRTYYNEIKGWDNLNESIGASIKASPNSIPANVHKNYFVWISDNMASVSSDEYPQLNNVYNDTIFTKKFCVLVKQNGDWKIAQMISTFPASYSLENTEWSINSDGYTLLQAGKVEEAIKVFKLNTELYPKSGNVWDSLGEGYMVAGNTELAIKNYEKSLEIDPSNDNAKDMLKKLKNE